MGDGCVSGFGSRVFPVEVWVVVMEVVRPERWEGVGVGWMGQTPEVEMEGVEKPVELGLQ